MHSRKLLHCLGALLLGGVASFGYVAAADDSKVTDEQIVAFLNSATPDDLTAKAGISVDTASGIVRYRDGKDGIHGTDDDVTFKSAASLKAQSPKGKLTKLTATQRAQIVKALKQSLTPPEPTNPLDALDAQKAFADHLLDELNAADWTKWENYPGLDLRRERRSKLTGTRSWGLAQARTPSSGPFKGGNTWGTSFFNPSSMAYIKGNLYPMATFKKTFFDKDGKLIADKHVVFPEDSIICKALFTTAVKPDMYTVEAGTTANDPASPTQTVGLAQFDIITKRAGFSETWTWTTYMFDPAAKNKFKLSVLLRNGSYVQTRYETEESDPADRSAHIDDDAAPHSKPGIRWAYMGPIDNPQSSCIACHQTAQYPQVNLGAQIATRDHLVFHHDGRYGTYPVSPATHPLKDQALRMDYLWEATQSLTDWETKHPDAWPNGATEPPDEGPVSGNTPLATGGPSDTPGLVGEVNDVTATGH